MSISCKTFYPVNERKESFGDKVTIVGVGMVGMACAISILGQKISRNVVLYDMMGDKVRGEVMDLQHGSLILQCPRISGSDDYALSANSKIVIITAGVRQQPGESRLNLSQRNADIIIKVVPELIKHSPETIILMVGNPCDVLTYVAWKISGFPAHRVIGAGTTLDSARFKYLLAQKFNCSPSSVDGWIIGEHGDNSIALWSGVNVAGVRLAQINPDIGTDKDKENWAEVHKAVIAGAGDIIDLKGYTNWGIGMSVAHMTSAILRNSFSICPVSVNINGKYGVTDDVFVPIPAVLSYAGITDVINLHLSEKEMAALQETVKTLKCIQDGIKMSKGGAHSTYTAIGLGQRPFLDTPFVSHLKELGSFKKRAVPSSHCSDGSQNSFKHEIPDHGILGNGPQTHITSNSWSEYPSQYPTYTSQSGYYDTHPELPHSTSAQLPTVLPEVPSQHEYINTSLTSPLTSASPMYNSTKSELDAIIPTNPRYPENNAYCPNNWGTNVGNYNNSGSYNYPTPNTNQQYPPVVIYPHLYSTVNQNQIHLHLHGSTEKLDQFIHSEHLACLTPRTIELSSATPVEVVPPINDSLEDTEREQTHDPSNVWRPY